MKIFFKNLLLFSLPVMALLALIAFAPVDKRLRYQHLENNCFNHGIWVHDRIFLNKNPIDIAFVGSSHTINGINDQLIEQETKTLKLKVANLGYCQLGRNFSYTIIKDLIKKKRPKLIIIEVREEEGRYSHPIFPYVADEEDIFLPEPLFNRDILKDAYTAFLYKLQLLQNIFYLKEEKAPVQKEDYGFATSPDTAAYEALEHARVRRSKKVPVQGMARDFYMEYPRNYLAEIAGLANNYAVQLRFLYIPAYGTTLAKPLEWQTYEQYGQLWIPPKAIILDKNNWFDKSHLNKAGAQKLSLWVAGKIQEH